VGAGAIGGGARERENGELTGKGRAWGPGGEAMPRESEKVGVGHLRPQLRVQGGLKKVARKIRGSGDGDLGDQACSKGGAQKKINRVKKWGIGTVFQSPRSAKGDMIPKKTVHGEGTVITSGFGRHGRRRGNQSTRERW